MSWYPSMSARRVRAPRPSTRWARKSRRRAARLSALGRLIIELGSRHEIHAIGLTGQCPSVVPIDGRGAPLRPGIIYRDNRAVAEADEFRNRFGDAYLHGLTGHL